MEAELALIAGRVEKAYRSARDDPGVAELVKEIGCATDDDLAELIEVDGRIRISLRRPVSLSRYLDAIDGLAGHELALDAAIDVALRSASGGARPTREAVEALTSQFPQFRTAIADAAMLGRAVVSTTGVSQLVQSSPQRVVPVDFGPRGESGDTRYRLIEVLGTGSSGEVYLAIDRLLSESDSPARVAIKVIGTQRRSTRTRLQLAEEASKARRVLHDNVVRVLDRGVSDEGEDYIVYEHIEGGDLDHWLEANGPRVSPERAAAMVAKIARGLQAAHLAGLVHCDLKPSNILVTKGGEPKVADFGIAVRESDLTGRAGESMRPMGNVAFISPEQYRGEPGSLGVQSDVYALGGILFYLLTGELPNGSTIEAVARTHDPVGGRKVAPELPRHQPGLNSDLVAICQRAMAVEPGRRHASAAELADDLDSWIRKEPIAWRRPSVWKVVRLAARRRPAIAASIAVAVLSVFAGTGAAGYWISVANENRVRADAADRTVNTARDEMATILRFLQYLRATGMGQDLIQTIVGLEGVIGTAVLGTPEQRLTLWKLRKDRVRDIISEYDGAGRGDHVETLMWQGVLGFWLVNDAEHDEAVERLESALAKWKAKGLSDDAMAEQTRRLWLCAKSLRCDARARAGVLTQEERDGLESLERDVMAAIDSRGLGGGFPTRDRLLESRMLLNGPLLLNRPDVFATAKQNLEKYRATMASVGPKEFPNAKKKPIPSKPAGAQTK